MAQAADSSAPSSLNITGLYKILDYNFPVDIQPDYHCDDDGALKDFILSVKSTDGPDAVPGGFIATANFGIYQIQFRPVEGNKNLLDIHQLKESSGYKSSDVNVTFRAYGQWTIAGRVQHRDQRANTGTVTFSSEPSAGGNFTSKSTADQDADPSRVRVVRGALMLGDKKLTFEAHRLKMADGVVNQFISDKGWERNWKETGDLMEHTF